MEFIEDSDDRKRNFSDNESADLKRPIDMTVPERIGLYSCVKFVRPRFMCKLFMSKDLCQKEWGFLYTVL